MLNYFLVILCFLVVYHHVLFPLILKRVKVKPLKKHQKSAPLPTITVLIPAYNEENTIFDKILNCAQLHYPREKLKIVVACDGCTDHTVQLAHDALNQPACAQLNAEIIDYTVNSGKVAVLNKTIPVLTSDLVALSDASSLLAKDALTRCASYFQNPNVGVVGGSYDFTTDNTSSETIYWQYQRHIKMKEAQLGAPMGMHGAFYVFRQRLARPMPAQTINDDFILPMKIVAKGYQAIYDPNIKTIETEQSSARMNWKRRIRISAGNIQQSLACLELLNPIRPGIAFCFFSGKFLRAWMPLFLIGIFLLTLIGSFTTPVYGTFLALQFCGLLLTFLPLKMPHKLSKARDAVRYLVIGHCAGMVGTFRYLIGLEKSAWKRAN